jgi:hypothetical protein
MLGDIMLRACLISVVIALPVLADPVKLGTVSSEPPKEWVVEKPKYTLRSHQFKIKSNEEGVADAEVIVSPQMKPDPEKVFPGCKAQFEPPEGKSADDISKVSKFEAGGATVHLLDIAGTWKYRERPNDPKSKEEKREDYRAIWAIVGVKDEATHVRFSGPSAVVAKHYDEFEKWLKAAK